MAADLDLRALARDERASLLDLVRALDEGQWHEPSLCAGWSVRDVIVHVVSYDDLGWSGLPGAFLRGGLRVDAVNEHVLRRHDDLSLPQVVALVERRLEPRGLTSGFGGAIALTDGMIHQQDVRRALVRPRAIPPGRLRAALDFSLRAPTLPSRANAKGLSLTATDLDWTHGSGETVSGPGEAILMALAGRTQALADLEGPGVATLASRLAR